MIHPGSIISITAFSLKSGFGRDFASQHPFPLSGRDQPVPNSELWDLRREKGHWGLLLLIPLSAQVWAPPQVYLLLLLCFFFFLFFFFQLNRVCERFYLHSQFLMKPELRFPDCFTCPSKLASTPQIFRVTQQLLLFFSLVVSTRVFPG